MLSLLLLDPDEAATVPLLHAFVAEHCPRVRIITPHFADEPWRAFFAEGTIPGESPDTSRVVGAHWPSELLAKLEDLFPGTGQDPP